MEESKKAIEQVKKFTLFAMALVVLFALASLFFHNRTFAVSACSAAVVAFISITLMIRRIVKSDIDSSGK